MTLAKVEVKLKFETRTKMVIEAEDIKDAERVLYERIAKGYYPHPEVKGAEFKLLEERGRCKNVKKD